MDIQSILTVIGSFLGSALGATLILFVAKLVTNRIANKVNAKKIVTETTKAVKEEFVDKVKNISFQQNILPVVKSELEKVNESATKVATEQLESLQVKYDKVLAILEKLINYFDDAPLILQEKKEEAHEALDDAKETETPTEIESNVVIEEIIDTPQESVQNVAQIER